MNLENNDRVLQTSTLQNIFYFKDLLFWRLKRKKKNSYKLQEIIENKERVLKVSSESGLAKQGATEKRKARVINLDYRKKFNINFFCAKYFK